MKGELELCYIMSIVPALFGADSILSCWLRALKMRPSPSMSETRQPDDELEPATLGRIHLSLKCVGAPRSASEPRPPCTLSFTHLQTGIMHNYTLAFAGWNCKGPELAPRRPPGRR